MIVSMSSGLNEAPSSIIWRTAMRQPASVSLSATMRSAVWQVVQALTTTSLPAPSGKSAAIAEKVHKSPNRDADRDRIYLIGYLNNLQALFALRKPVISLSLVSR